MTQSDIVVFTIESLTYYSRSDEDSFFKWLGKIKAVASFEGEGRCLYVSVDKKKLNAVSFSELTALFYRYGVDMRQFARLKDEGFANLFENSNLYWFRKVFPDEG